VHRDPPFPVMVFYIKRVGSAPITTPLHEASRKKN
jgi:hypothetical protein